MRENIKALTAENDRGERRGFPSFYFGENDVDIQDFSTPSAEAARNLPSEEPSSCQHGSCHGTGIPNGPTERHVRLKENYLRQVPSITIHRARAITKIARENPGLPRIMMRAKAFRYCCETAPLVIQDHELIVGAPNGAPRAGAFSPDISWRWLRDELDTIGQRPQDPFFVSEEDKKILREEIFPYWEGKSVDEFCESQYREAGLWEMSGESFVSDCSYHALNGGGDSNPGYDVILMKKGMLDIQREAREHLDKLDYENPDDLEKIYFYGHRHCRRRHHLQPPPVAVCRRSGRPGTESRAASRIAENIRGYGSCARPRPHNVLGSHSGRMDGGISAGG